MPPRYYSSYYYERYGYYPSLAYEREYSLASPAKKRAMSASRYSVRSPYSVSYLDY